jgi:signal transduction histidine kinase/FixJ family two-component response regulator
MLTVLSVRREQQTFQRELEQQASLLLDTLEASSVDFLYFLDADFLSDLMLDLGRFEVVTFGRIYDDEGRIVADALDPNTRFRVAPDPFGQQLLTNDEIVYQWEQNQLLAGKPVILGVERIGAIAVGLPTAPLTAKLTALRNQVTAVAFFVSLVGIALALLFSRSITDPVQAMIKATNRIREGDLSHRLDIKTGDELALLGSHFNDMTTQLENTLRQMEAEIEQRKQTQVALEAAKNAAEAANRAKSTFLANMSHELRTPLNAILGFSELMFHDKTTSPAQQENLQVISRSGEHLLGLINQVLDMSKIEAGRTTSTSREFNLYRTLSDVETMFRLKAQDQGVRLIVERAVDVPQHIRSDEMKLRQILINLLTNAFKFTEVGYVRLRVDCRRETAVATIPLCVLLFTIEDSGPGIEPDELHTLFQPFVQTKAGQERGGTGLGLSLSRQFARLLGGDISASNVQDKPGHGAIFQFHIQVEEVQAMSVVQDITHQRVIGLDLPAGQAPHRLLVVDNNHDSRQVLVRLLRPLGFDIREAVNGQEALDVWQTWQPHLIWMDLNMPVLNGYAATQQIKATPQGQQTIVVITTASAFIEDMAEIQKSGGDDFIRKPMQTKEIFDILQRQLNIQFVYEPAETKPNGEQVTAVSPSTPPNSQTTLHQALTLLPLPLLTRFRRAAVETDMVAIETCIDDISQHNPLLGQELKKLADDFDYGKILAILPTALPSQ